MILLTGGTGFLGRYILEALADRGTKVRLLARNPENVKDLPDYAEVVQGDILDVLSIERAMEGVEYVIHSAAVVSFWKKRREEMRIANVEGTANMVNAALNAQVKKFVQVSSISALSRPVNPQLPLDEKTKWVKSSRNTYYGRTKYLAELEVARGVEEGLKAAMVNPGIILGDGFGSGGWDTGSAKLFKKVYDGLKFYTAGKTCFVAADDVAKAIVLLLDSSHVNAERFVMGAENFYYKAFFEKVAKALEVKPPTKQPPESLAVLTGRVNEWKSGFSGKEPIITPETARTAQGVYEYDGSKITRELGFEYMDLDTVIERTAKTYLETHGNRR